MEVNKFEIYNRNPITHTNIYMCIHTHMKKVLTQTHNQKNEN